MDYIALLCCVLGFFCIYKIYMMAIALVSAIRELVGVQEVIVTKVDRVSAVLDDLPRTVKRIRDREKKNEKDIKS